MCAALTASLDRTVSELIDSGSTSMAVVALGGYGRGELSLYSDVDLMLLHEVDDPSAAAAGLFRPLWDAKLRVGHAVRTVREASEAARERFDTHTTLLTSRLVAGSEELFDHLLGEVTRVTRARPLRRHLVDAERARRADAPFRLMAVDVKTGRGGLRALQGFEWERRREELIGRFSTQHRGEEDEAREVLLQVRNALHAVTGRAHDVFSPELREPAARWLGRNTVDTAGELVAAMQTIDHLAERKWPEVLEDRDRPIGRRAWSRITGPTEVRTDSPPTIDDLDRLLQTGDRGRAVFDRLWEEGHLTGVLPEWGVVAALPQLEPFHQHPVAAHLWRTVAEMETVGSDRGSLGSDMFAERPRLLRLAAFLHDIGKGHGGQHAEVGAGIAAEFSARVGLDADTTDLLVRAVRHHLLLPLTATRRDLDDPAVIDEVAGEIGSLRMLQVLYLLTIADSRATGPSMWNDWKASLLKTLFLRCAARIDAETPSIDAGGATRKDVLARWGGTGDSMANHLDAMPDDYLRSLSADEVIWHFELISGVVGASNLGVRAGDPIDTVVVVGPLRPGFRRTVAAVFAANGVDVLEARLFGRSDGLVVDSFRVRDDRTGGVVPGERWDRVRVDVEAGLSGGLDTETKVAARAAAYPVVDGSRPTPSAAISTDPATGEVVVVVKCSDRIGRLAEILGILDVCGLDIRLAKLDSRAGEVIDTFHIGTDPSTADLDPTGLEQRIAAGITP